MKKYVRFDRDMSSIVKGFAILFMIKLHSYGKALYEVPLNYDHAFWFAHDGFNICVGIFAFMLGFGYAFSKTKDLKYGWQHIKKLYIPYITIFLLFILPTCYKEFFASGWEMMVYTLTGLDFSFYYYNWFIYVFIFAMLVLPAITRFIDRKPLRNAIIAIVVFYFLEVFAHFVIMPYLNKTFLFLFFNCLTLMPIIILGYLFAHEHYYERIRVDNLPKPLVLVACILTLVAMIYADSRLRVGGGIVFEFFYAPIAVGAIAVLFSKFEFKYFRKVMIKLGWASMYIWFLQALVHTPIVRTVYQPVVTAFFKDINLVAIWTAIVLFFAAWALRSVIDYLLGKITHRSVSKF